MNEKIVMNSPETSKPYTQIQEIKSQALHALGMLNAAYPIHRSWELSMSCALIKIMGLADSVAVNPQANCFPPFPVEGKNIQ